MSGVSWRCAAFDALTKGELYELLQLRSEVFVVEQACAFQDMDGMDAQALHLLGTLGDELVAYARCFAPGVKFVEASIGRVATRARLRGTGCGHALMQQAILLVGEQWGRQAIRISAQQHLESFYSRHGFAVAGAAFLEDGIAHVEMLRPA